jgi:LmbE family N-acetylglucosaminyl deacetylase
MVAFGERSRADMLRCARPLAPKGGWLVIAPHQDDETLGAGGLIADLAAKGEPASVAFLTDGSGSHPDSLIWPAERVAKVRRGEADHALATLGGRKANTIHLGWQDGHPFAPGTPPFTATVNRLLGVCRRRQILSVATTWRGEGHGDHYAAYLVAAELVRRSYGRIKLFEYVVWGWTYPQLKLHIRPLEIFAVPTARHSPRLRRAIRHHRSQLTGLITDSVEGFRLPPGMIALTERRHEILLKGQAGLCGVRSVSLGPILTYSVAVMVVFCPPQRCR